MGVDGMVDGQVHRYSEFFGGLTGACGPNALAMAQDWAFQNNPTGANRTAEMVRWMVAEGILPPNNNGISDPDELYRSALGLKMKVMVYQPWTDGWSGWKALVDAQLAAGRIVVVFVHNGQALQDERTGAGENAVHLQNHVIVLVGKFGGGWSTFANRTLDAGYWALDGDNFDVGDFIQYYSAGVVAAALPSAALAIAASVPLGSSGTGMGAPSGWTDDGTTLRAPNGIGITGAIRSYIMNRPVAWRPDDMPVAPTYYVGNQAAHQPPVEYSPGGIGFVQGAVLDCRYSRLFSDATQNWAVKELWVGSEYHGIRGLYEKLLATPPAPAPFDPTPVLADLALAKSTLQQASSDIDTAVSKLPK